MTNKTMVNEKEAIKDESTKEKEYSYETARRFSGHTYMPTEDIIKFLKRSAWIQHWAVILHDKDMHEVNGEMVLKEAHTHILIHTYHQKTASAIVKNFDRLARQLDSENPQNTLMQICSDSHIMYRYHRHLDDANKYQYSECDRIVDDITYWNRLCDTDSMTESGQNLGLSMVDDLINGASSRAMVERYGKEYIYHQKHIKDVAYSITREESQPPIAQLLDEDMIKAMLYNDDCPLFRQDVVAFFNVVDYLKKVLKYETGEKLTTADIFEGVTRK